MTLTIRAAKAKTTAHSHTCMACAWVWPCAEPTPLVSCIVSKAARVNGAGPWCSLCLHLEMAARYARAFHRPEIAGAVAVIQQQVKTGG